MSRGQTPGHGRKGRSEDAKQTIPTRGKSAVAHTEKPARPAKPKRVSPKAQKAARKALAPAALGRKPRKNPPPPRPFALVLVEVDRALEPVAE
jgi:hypothetical protein